MAPEAHDENTPAWPTPRARPAGPTPPPPPNPAPPGDQPTISVGPPPGAAPGSPPAGGPPPGPPTAPPPPAPPGAPPGYPPAPPPPGSVPPPGAVPPGAVPPGAVPPQPFAGGPTAPPPRRSRKGVVAAALVAVGALAVAAVGFLVVRAVTGDGGGASSPEAAVEQLVEAVDAEDPIALLDVVDPAEAEALSDAYAAIADQASELGFAPAEEALGGVDVEVRGVRYDVEELGDGVARVTLTGGRADIGLDADGFGDLTQRVVEAETDDDGLSDRIEVGADDLVAEDEEGDDLPPFLVTVERDGGWYVSILHTAAQYAVDTLGLDPPTFPNPDAGEGADDPEGAVRDLLVAAGGLDGDAVGDLLTEGPGGAVRSYAGALEEWVGAAADDASAEVDVLETEVTERDGGGRRVVVERVEGSVTWTDPDDGDEMTADVTWDGTCLEVTAEDDDEDVSGDESDSDFCLTEGWERVGVDALAVVTTEQDGGWRVDPLATVADYAEAVAPELSAEVVLRVLGTLHAAEPTATLEIGEPTDITLNDAGFAVLTFEASAGQRLTLSTQVAGDDEDDDGLGGYLVGPDGEEESVFSIIEPDASGEYRLVVGTDAWSPADVSVTVNEVVEAEITVGEAADGEIATPGAVVEHPIELAGSSAYLLDVDNPDLDVQVLDPDGDDVDLEETDEGATSFETDAGGRYRVRVDGGFEEATGSYTITVSEADAFVLGDGTTAVASGTITGPDGEPFVDLTVRGGAVVRADVTSTDPALDLVVIIRDPDSGEEITRFDDTGPGGIESIRFTPDVTTTWRIGVQAVGDAEGPVQVEAVDEG